MKYQSILIVLAIIISTSCGSKTPAQNTDNQQVESQESAMTEEALEAEILYDEISIIEAEIDSLLSEIDEN